MENNEVPIQPQVPPRPVTPNPTPAPVIPPTPVPPTPPTPPTPSPAPTVTIPVMPQTAAPAPKHSNSVAAIIGTLVVLAAVVLGGLYFWGAKTNREAAQSNIVEEPSLEESITAQSSSDDTSSIETDLDATEIDNMDAELDAIY